MGGKSASYLSHHTLTRRSKRWLLVAEAWVFLILASLDYAAHQIIRDASSLAVFEPMDKAIGTYLSLYAH